MGRNHYIRRKRCERDSCLGCRIRRRESRNRSVGEWLLQSAEDPENPSLVSEIREKYQIKISGNKATIGELMKEEMSTSLAQELAFAEEIYALSKNLKLPLKSSLCTFKPFLEEVRQLRVGGRILHAPMDYATKHPYCYLQISLWHSGYYGVITREKTAYRTTLTLLDTLRTYSS